MEMTRYTDKELVELVRQSLQATHTDWSSQVAAQRVAAFDYYYGELPAVTQKNTSDHVSRDVFDAVESVREKLLRVFTSGRRVVRFAPMSEDDVEAALARTKYVEAIVMKRNAGYTLLQSAFQDALLQKICCVKRYWKTEVVQTPKTFTAPEEVVREAMAQGLDVTEVSDITEQVVPVPTAQGIMPMAVKMASGTAMEAEDRSRVVIEVVPPEDMFIDGSAETLDKARFFAVRWRKSRAQLIAEGFPYDIVAGLSSTDSLADDAVDNARRSFDASTAQDDAADELALLTGYEAYIYLDAETPKGEDAGEATLWQIIVCGDQVLAKEPVSEAPFRSHRPVLDQVANHGLE